MKDVWFEVCWLESGFSKYTELCWTELEIDFNYEICKIGSFIEAMSKWYAICPDISCQQKRFCSKPYHQNQGHKPANLWRSMSVSLNSVMKLLSNKFRFLDCKISTLMNLPFEESADFLHLVLEEPNVCLLEVCWDGQPLCQVFDSFDLLKERLSQLVCGYKGPFARWKLLDLRELRRVEKSRFYWVE